MSKIEKALKKAKIRNSGGSLVSFPGGQSGQQLIPIESYSKSAETEVNELAVSSKEIVNMLDADLLSKKEKAERHIIFPEMEDIRVMNAFREIRTKVLQKTSSQNVTVMVTSLSNSDGSSFVVKNLAAAFAFDESKTAIILDCNLRNPGLHQLLKDKEALGLTDYLEDTEIIQEDIIHPLGINRLRVIPAGSEKEIASEYFTSLRMRHLLDHLKERYPDRFLIMDTGPITESADTRILVELCDFVLLVVCYGKATESQILAAIEEIDEKKLLGVVFNNTPHIPPSLFSKIALRFKRKKNKKSG